MDRTRWIVLAVLLAVLAGVQHFGLERSEEMRAEAPHKQFKGLPASEILPTYIASLFFGAFRAVAVDVLWIQLKKVEEEKRWYERREILRLISYFQPNNPEVWATLGWHSAYNVANGFTDPEKSWEWVVFGLQWLRRGIRTLPQHPYLKHQLAYTLMHKPSWREGPLDEALLDRIENHPGLQADLLPDDVPPGPPRSAFDLAALWLERARDEIFAMEAGQLKTQMGLYLYASTFDGFIRQCQILEARRWLQKGRLAETRLWLGRAEAHVRAMLSRTYKEIRSPIFDDYARLYARYPALLDLLEASQSGGEPESLALLRALQEQAEEFGLLEEGLWWRPWDAQAPLNALKLRLTGGRDLQEFNDTVPAATPLRPGDLVLATFDPPGLDRDVYALHVPGGGPEQEAPREPIPVRVRLSVPSGSQATFKVALVDSRGAELRTLSAGPDGTYVFPADRFGTWLLRVDPAAPAADSRYRLQYAVGE